MTTAARPQSPPGPGEGSATLEVKKVLAGMSAARLAYQPIVDLDQGRVVGYEALARFGAGHRSPAPYFAAADELGRRDELEALLVEQALATRHSVPEDRFVSVNVSPVLLTGGPVWSSLVAAGDLSGVVVELTEHAPVDNLPRLRRRLDTLRDAGGTLALDDVGAGWSGLQQVVELRPEIVKIDRSLVQRLHEDRARRAVAELLGAFTAKVGGSLLAEGVEQLEELSALLALDVHLAQGWLLGRPQFGWPEVPTGAAAVLAATHRAERQVGSLAVDVPRVPHVASLGFLTDGLPTSALLLDGDAALRAVWVRNPHDSGPSGWTVPVSVVAAHDSVLAALRQAFARPASRRMEPLVCLAADGAVLGLVDPADLVAALL